jgi:hypothetical protein
MNQSVSVMALASATLTTGTSTGTIVDMNPLGNNFRDVEFVLTVGTITNGTFTITMFESDASNFAGPTAVDSFRVTGTLPVFDSTTDDQIYTWSVRPTKRYVRLTCTIASGAAGGPCAAVAVLSNGSTNPPRRV